MTDRFVAEARSLLPPGSLWPRVIEQTQHALAVGALKSIPTEYEQVEQQGLSFVVRTVVNLVRKDRNKQAQVKKGADFNPFLPYEPDLFVADLTPTHLCLLNKFNVVDYHLLLVTRAFEEQDNWLTLADFVALWISFTELDGLAFYNGGRLAGASQRHKHLQIVPLPLIPDGCAVPIAPAIAATQFNGAIGQSPMLPFMHAIARFDASAIDSPLQAAQRSLDLYHQLLRAVGLVHADQEIGIEQTGAYNLLVTRDWMMVVPRSQETFETISVNSLGFAGALLVRTEDDLARLKQIGPLTVLQAVGMGD